MLSIKAPIDENEPASEAATIEEVRDREPEPASPVVRGSRWVDYDIHELLEMISDLEDERRWARLREGVLWAVIVHAAIILALFLLPKYIYQPKVIEPSAKSHDDWTYLDSPIAPPKL